MISIRRLLPVLLGIVSLCALLGTSRLASAQISILRELPTETPRPNNPQIISKEDCDTTSVDITFTGLSAGDNVSVWVSEDADCTLATQRTMDGAQCYDTEIRFGGSNAVNTTETLVLKEILEPFPAVNDCIDSAGVLDGRQLRIYFLVNASGTDVTNSVTSNRYTSFDLVGATPPILERLVSADDSLLTGTLSGLNAVDAQSYKIYCERLGDAPVGTGGATTSSTASSGGMGGAAGGTAGMGGVASAGGGGLAGTGGSGGVAGTGGADAGSGGADAGSGGALSVDETCSSAPRTLSAGEVPPTDLLRGDSISASIQAEGLDDGEWACGVAGTDNLGNPGVLSNVLCAVPEPVTDFFEAYRNAGGLAGGGFCQCSLPGADREHDWAIWSALTLALSFLVRRNARERIRR